MVLLKEPLEYRDGEVLCEGHIALNTLSRAKRPCVLIAHAWNGPNEQIRAKASNLARMGYLGFALDVYGKGVRGGPSDDNTQLMAPISATGLCSDAAYWRRWQQQSFIPSQIPAASP